MLPFFRKIRWRLAANNQFFKYSRYAIGEIVLVVIGILIALYINNWNEERKKEKKIEMILDEIQRDILFNLESIDNTIVDQSFQDSLMNMILADTLEVQDYIENPQLISAIAWIAGPTIRAKGFDKLKSFEEEISNKFSRLNDSIQSVYSIYEHNQEQVKRFSDLIRDTNKWKTDNWEWYSKVFLDGKDGRNDETMDILVNNPFYRNRVYRTRYNLENQNWIASRFESYFLYHKIGEYTGVKELPPKYRDLIETNLEEYSGTYKWKDTTNISDPSARIIEIYNDRLKYHFDDYYFYMMKKDSFANYYDNTIFFKRDSSNQIIGATRYVEGQFFDLEKVD